MSDLVITPSQVLAAADAARAVRNASVAITAGDALYVNAAGTWGLAQCDGSAEEAGSLGLAIALNDAAVGQPVYGATGGVVTLGAAAAPVQAMIYCVAALAGNICPYADLLTTNKLAILAYGIGTNQIRILIVQTGIAKP